MLLAIRSVVMLAVRSPYIRDLHVLMSMSASPLQGLLFWLDYCDVRCLMLHASVAVPIG